VLKAVVAVLDDLFFNVKIADGAKRAGLSVTFVKTEDAALGKLRESPSILVVDLNCAAVDPLTLVKQAKAEFPGVPAIGYVSHVQTDLRAAALAAGFDFVLPRSVFSTRIADVLLENAG
jgi:CheY-like chemotaxis protein